jgi:hypothetical protein
MVVSWAGCLGEQVNWFNSYLFDVCVCVYVCASICVRARVRVCVRVHVRVRVRVHECNSIDCGDCAHTSMIVCVAAADMICDSCILAMLALRAQVIARALVDLPPRFLNAAALHAAGLLDWPLPAWRLLVQWLLIHTHDKAFRQLQIEAGRGPAGLVVTVACLLEMARALPVSASFVHVLLFQTLFFLFFPTTSLVMYAQLMMVIVCKTSCLLLWRK